MNRWLERESRKWVQEGILDPETRAKIMAKYPSAGWQQMVLSLLAGVAIGASILAFWALLAWELNLHALQGGWNVALFFLAFGVPLVLAGTLLPAREWARPLLLGGLFPMVAAMFPSTIAEFVLLIPISFIAPLIWLRNRNIRFIMILVAFLVSVPVFLTQFFDEDSAVLIWFGVSGVVLVGAWFLHEQPWSDAARMVTTLSIIASWFAMVIAVFEPNFDGGYSLLFSMGMLPILGVSIWQKENAPTFAAGSALTIGLVAFAFESGGPIAGVIALVTLSAGFLFLSFRKKP